MIYWEDAEIGLRRELGSYTFSEEEIVRFARKYDPQPFHVDAQAAQRSIFGGLVASGWHTVAIWMKLSIAERVRTRGTSPLMRAGVSPGYEDMRWMKPVRPGMTLTYTSETVGKAELRSRRDFAILLTRNEARDEKGELVFRFTGKSLVQRRPIDERPMDERPMEERPMEERKEP